MGQLKVAACQLVELREDIANAVSIINDYAEQAAALDVHLLCFPECFLQGYLLEEAVARQHALDLDHNNFKNILQTLPACSPTLVIGLIETANGHLYNSAIVVKNRQLQGVYRKTHLLGGEHIFTAGVAYPVFSVNGLIFGINICYDTNFPSAARNVADQGAHLIVCPANNMMSLQKSERYKHIHNSVRAERCRETGLPLISSDVTGERDNRVSYGPTAMIDSNGHVIDQIPLGETGMFIAEIDF